LPQRQSFSLSKKNKNSNTKDKNASPSVSHLLSITSARSQSTCNNNLTSPKQPLIRKSQNPQINQLLQIKANYIKAFAEMENVMNYFIDEKIEGLQTGSRVKPSQIAERAKMKIKFNVRFEFMIL